MPELNDLPEIEPADVSDDDFILLFDNSAPTNKSRKATRSDFLKDVAREGGDHNFGVSEIEELTANAATMVALNVTSSLAFDDAATVQKVYHTSSALAVSTLADGAGETITAAVVGVLTSDQVLASFAEVLPDGLSYQAWVSAGDTVSVRFLNSSGGSIAAASYASKITAIRFV